MPQDDAYLLDILGSAKIALQHVSDTTQDDFYEDILCQDAVVRRIEIIGEAARRVSAETKRKYPQLPWKAMIGMRNVAIHEYDSLDIDVIWDIVQNDLPALVAALEKIVPAEN